MLSLERELQTRALTSFDTPHEWVLTINDPELCVLAPRSLGMCVSVFCSNFTKSRYRLNSNKTEHLKLTS